MGVYCALGAKFVTREREDEGGPFVGPALIDGVVTESIVSRGSPMSDVGVQTGAGLWCNPGGQRPAR
jgi:hypothetical protein